MKPLDTFRQDYDSAPLRRADLDPDPVRLFQRWLDEAFAAEVREANAMTLATASPDGRPSARVVLLKHADERGFVFATNYGSRKGRELEANAQAALVFYWQPLHRQVRVEGSVVRCTPEESDEVFRARPRAARIGALASPQSDVLAGRQQLETAVAEQDRRHPGEDVPRPAEWGAYRLSPEAIEFWVGRVSRLHDRFRYRRAGGSWQVDRLAP